MVMYDIKTHETEAIRANIEDYERQLNVYAHIWQNLRGQRLDETAVICTQLPEALKQAANVRDERRMAYELGRWEPVIPIPFEPGHVAETVREFGETVDEIEDGCFAPPDLTTLQARLPGTTHLCDRYLSLLRRPLLVRVVPAMRTRRAVGSKHASGSTSMILATRRPRPTAW
ncbi:MAG: hypothetical protein IPF85_25010 [Anaerolineae bacterium]|nr:hypothetical protein [Anaerolineae bacterium]